MLFASHFVHGNFISFCRMSIERFMSNTSAQSLVIALRLQLKKRAARNEPERKTFYNLGRFFHLCLSFSFDLTLFRVGDVSQRRCCLETHQSVLSSKPPFCHAMAYCYFRLREYSCRVYDLMTNQPIVIGRRFLSM
jgi:hypothetical protein